MAVSGSASPPRARPSFLSPLRFLSFSFFYGMLAAFVFYFLPGYTPGTGESPRVDYSALLGAAGVLVTIAVATALTDLPFTRGLTRKDGNRPDRRPRVDHHTELQLKLSSALLTLTTLLAMTCAGLALIQIIAEDTSVDGGLREIDNLPIAAVTIGIHFTIALVGSMGLRSKQQRYLQERQYERIRRQYSLTRWRHLWGLTTAQATQLFRKPGLYTSVLFVCIGLILLGIGAFALLVLTDTTVTVLFRNELFYMALYVLIITGSLYFSLESLFAYEIGRRVESLAGDLATNQYKIHLFIAGFLTFLLTIVQLSYILLYFDVTTRFNLADSPRYPPWQSHVPWVYFGLLSLLYLASVYYVHRRFLPRFRFDQRHRGCMKFFASLFGRMLEMAVVQDRRRNIRYLRDGTIPKWRSRHQRAVDIVNGVPPHIDRDEVEDQLGGSAS